MCDMACWWLEIAVKLQHSRIHPLIIAKINEISFHLHMSSVILKASIWTRSMRTTWLYKCKFTWWHTTNIISQWSAFSLNFNVNHYDHAFVDANGNYKSECVWMLWKTMMSFYFIRFRTSEITTKQDSICSTWIGKFVRTILKYSAQTLSTRRCKPKLFNSISRWHKTLVRLSIIYNSQIA